MEKPALVFHGVKSLVMAKEPLAMTPLLVNIDTTDVLEAFINTGKTIERVMSIRLNTTLGAITIYFSGVHFRAFVDDLSEVRAEMPIEETEQ